MELCILLRPSGEQQRPDFRKLPRAAGQRGSIGGETGETVVGQGRAGQGLCSGHVLLGLERRR